MKPYTVPSTVIRIAHKLGFQGWSDFKEAFLDEVIYLNSHFQEIDSNYPFTSQDTIMQIAHKIIQLHIESANDTAFGSSRYFTKRCSNSKKSECC